MTPLFDCLKAVFAKPVVAISDRQSACEARASEAENCVPLKLHRRGFLKSSAAIGALSFAELSISAMANRAFAAVGGFYKLLDLPFMGNLSPIVGVRPTVTRLSGVSVSPKFAYDGSGNALGILVKHGSTSAAEGSVRPISVSWENLGAAIWEKRRVPVCRANTGTASDGTDRLWRLREGRDVGSHLLQQRLPQLVKGQTYTLNAVVRSGQVRYVGLQLKAFDGKYRTARFDLASRAVYKSFGEVNIGVKQLNNGLVHIWASYKAGWGTKAPLMNLMFLSPYNAATSFAGEDRSLYVSEFWAAKGAAANDLPGIGNGLSGGLLSEPADLQSGDWIKSGLSSFEAGAGIASDGTNRLWKLTEDGQNGVHSVSQDVGVMKQGTTYTLSVVVKSDQVRFVALQLKTFANEFSVARFDLLNQTTASNYQAIDYGVIKKANGLVQLWASFASGSGNNVPRVSFQLLAANGFDSIYLGNNRSVLFSEFWVNQGKATTAMPDAEDSEPVVSGTTDYDVVSVDGIRHISPNDCAGIFSFQYRAGLAGMARIWHTGASENDYTAVSITRNRLIFDKVSSGVVTRCSYGIAWQTGQVYRVGWRASSITGMELVLNGQRVARNRSAMARRASEVGSRLIFGSDGKQHFSNCPIGNMTIFSEG